MSCYHPFIMYPKGDGKFGTLSLSKDMSWKELKLMFPGAFPVSCGHCIGCRLDYSRSWADRMMLELETAKKAIFVTLTYDNASINIKTNPEGDPIGYTVDKRDCQLFMKRLRRAYDGTNGKPLVKIRFYLASEYGPSTLRPHNHAIIFGLGIDDFPDRIPRGMNELHQQYYEIPQITDIWKCGMVLCSDVSYETCAYVARYVMKKVRDDPEWHVDRGVDPEFTLMSRNPGIGAYYLEQHPDCMDFENISVSTEKGAKKIMIPKYFLRKLGDEKSSLYNKEKYDKICAKRAELAEDRLLSKLSRITLSYVDQLEVEEEHKLRSIFALKRGDL